MASYDIHFQEIPAEQQAGASGRVFSFGYTSAVGVKGPQKLVNRWLKCFCTLRGSDLLDPTYGTGFPDLLGSNVSSRQDFVDAMAMFITDCNDKISSFDQAQFPPDDERLDSAVMVSVVASPPDGFDVYVNIKNVAGTTLTVQVPTGSTRP